MEQFPEKQSGIERVLGTSPDEEARLLRLFGEALRNQEAIPYETEKDEEQIETINLILNHISAFVREYGGRGLSGLTQNNIHFIDATKLSAEQKETIERENIGAICDFETQSAIVLLEDNSKLITAQRVVHELIHLHAFTSFEAESKHSETSSMLMMEGKKLYPRRIGFGAFDKTHMKRYFRNFDEAIVEELSTRFDTEYFFSIPALTSELEQREKMRRMVKTDAQEIAAVITKEEAGGRWTTVIESWRYGNERRRLRSLIHEIYQGNRERFGSEEDVFVIFAKAVMTGRILDAARLVESTFGKGSFANLGRETMIEGGSSEKH